MHLKRPAASKIWPIPRKGTKYLVVPSHQKKLGIPLLIVMREVLGLVKTRKELKKVLLEGKVLVNDSPTRDESRSLVLFDTLSIPSQGKYYRATFSEIGKITFEEISDKDVKQKIAKLHDKKVLKGKKVQLNFNYGRNIISSEKINVGDSAIVNFKDKKILKVLPVVEKAKVMVIKGKHRGQKGVIQKIDEKVMVKTSKGDFEIDKEELVVTQ